MYSRDSFEHSIRQPHSAHYPAIHRFLSPADSQTCAHSFSQTLSFDRLPQNTRGEGWGYSLANSFDPNSGPLSPLTPFPSTLASTHTNPAIPAPRTSILATLTDTPSRKSFRYHSYEKHRGRGYQFFLSHSDASTRRLAHASKPTSTSTRQDVPQPTRAQYRHQERHGDT